MTPHNRLRRFAPPRASNALRERALAGARDAVASSIAPSRADRIWFSVGWRFAWLAAIAACVVVEVSSARSATSAYRAPRPAAAVAREADAAAAEIGLSGSGLLGDRVVTNDRPTRNAMEVML